MNENIAANLHFLWKKRIVDPNAFVGTGRFFSGIGSECECLAGFQRNFAVNEFARANFWSRKVLENADCLALISARSPSPALSYRQSLFSFPNSYVFSVIRKINKIKSEIRLYLIFYFIASWESV